MPTLEQLRDKRNSGLDIQSVVKTMKSFAAVHIRQYQKADAALRAYVEVVEQALADMLVFSPLPSLEHRARTKAPAVVGIIAFGSDQGLVGSFNEQAASKTAELITSLGGTKILLCSLGARLAQQLEGLGHTPDTKLTMPASTAAAGTVLQNILAVIDQWRGEHSLSAIQLVGNHSSGGGSCTTEVFALLPPSKQWLADLKKRPPRSNQHALVPIPEAELARALVSQYITVHLQHALIASLTCENAMRLLAMQLAEKHIEEYLEDLTRELNQERQNIITGELLDIVGGVEAITRSKTSNSNANANTNAFGRGSAPLDDTDLNLRTRFTHTII